MSTLRIHRYILREITVPAALGLFIFTFVLFMGRILKLTDLVINRGIPLAEVGALFASLLPAFLVITVPLAFLLGVLLGFGRLSGESEVIALKASGFSLYGMLTPVLALALAASAATAFFTLYLEPAGNAAFRRLVFQIAASRAHIGLQPRVFNQEFDGLVIYANSVDELTSRMEGVLISDERVGNVPAVILAREGRIITDREALTLTLRLEDGTIHRHPPSGEEDAYQIVGFGTYDVNLNLGRQAATEDGRPKKAKEMMTSELLRAMRTASPEDLKSMEVEFNQRLIFPLAPLLFAMIGVPLGIQSQRSGRGGGFALGLVVFLVYYVFLSLGETLAKGGVPTAAALWLPNLLFLAAGGYLLVRTAQEKRFFLFDLLDRVSRLLARRRQKERRP